MIESLSWKSSVGWDQKVRQAQPRHRTQFRGLNAMQPPPSGPQVSQIVAARSEINRHPVILAGAVEGQPCRFRHCWLR
jgi:hypothetical protein